MAAALAAQADFLITLDKGLKGRVTQAGLGMTALSPGEFLQTVLPQHPEHRQIRNTG